jgi:S-DNA-T family DNA segregation ATPase FtsK/SpoIIIE
MAEQKRKPGRPKGSKNKATREKLDAELAKKQAQSRLKNEIWAIVIIAVGAFLAISLHTQAAGELGRIISDLLKGLFAAVAYALPYYLILYGLMLFFRRSARIGARSVMLLCLIFLMATVINSARYLDAEGLSISLSFIKDAYNNGVVLGGGGAFGMTLGLLLKKAIGIPGLYIFSLVVIVISLMLVVNIPASQFIEGYREKRKEAMKDKETKADAEATAESSIIMPDPVEKAAIEVPGFLSGSVTNRQMKIIDYVKDDELFETGQKSESLGFEKPGPVEPGKGLTGEEDTGKEKPAVNKKNKGLGNEQIEELKIDLDKEEPISYIEPPLDLLDKAKSTPKANENINLKQKALKLEETLKNFGVNAKVVQVTKGPAITRYEIQPSVGVKVSSIVRLADDIALNLEAKSIRMEAPIPGKAAVGI